MFPAARYDDQVDSTAQALAWSKQRPPGWAITEHYRQEVERLKAPQLGASVRFLAPEGTTHVQGLSGRTYLVRERIVEVDGADAPPLLGAGFRPNP
jgi:hypothetical protein